MKLIFFLFVFSAFCYGQIETPAINTINKRIETLEEEKKALMEEIEVLKLNWIQDEIVRVGVPRSETSESSISHSAYSLSYNEDHEQANWVMHIILPEIVNGNTSRSNDFREDSLVTTGTSFEEDYFLKTKKDDGKYEYDGFGYDRGHLAPSADFKWSKKALSESYFYSNMSPQRGDFNREDWAELESILRGYVINNEVPLYIVTMPVIKDDLLKVERGVNKVSIPKYFVKVALDLKNKRGIGFILPHEKIELPLEAYAVSIDSVESMLGYDLFSTLDDQLENSVESQSDYKPWLPDGQKDDVVFISQDKLPKNAVNTSRVKGMVNNSKPQTVCGKVVNTKKHEKGHVFIDLDKKFPNQVFSVSIFVSSIKNFDYEPEVYLMNQEVCFTGKVGEYRDTPNMIIENSKQVRLLEEF